MTNENNKNELREHSFDGIQEYDNDLPRWWVRLFYATIVFSLPYFIWYHVPYFPSKSLVDEYNAEANVGKTQQAAASASTAFDASNPEVIGKGKADFATNCASCHGAEGQGVIGPNLTDDFWIHGHTLAAVEDIINKGVPAKGMPSWESILGKQKILQIVAYLKSVQGVSVANPKAPQGDAGKLE